ncbi:MAG: SDR family oxidoreductase [Gammaproteobacteria bacterium]|jgi:NAD(P)-dependent dehydrogenase (short-subunit alcohol dehydrogenase family)|nr:SDR family oxidoreductase [Gammaproteobacteria bacterium]
MNYFITGGTGFIGRHLIDQLLQRKGDVYVLLRKDSRDKFKQLVNDRWAGQAKRIIPVTGDLTKRKLGVSAKQLEALHGKVRHVFHLAAMYDMTAGMEEQHAVNIDGTRHAVQFAESIAATCFHHTSSIAAAGMYRGVFREDMFAEAENLDHPYLRTKHDSEALVRDECKIPWRIYRPGIVLGHSESGEIDKIDGPYYFFKMIQKMRRMLPQWMPTLGIEGGRINMVPVDFVAKAMDHIAHKPRLNGKCFHLTDPKPRRIGEVLNIFANAGHAPLMTMRIDARMFSFIPAAVKQGLNMLPPVRRISNHVLHELGVPRAVLGMLNYPTRFDCRETEAALKGTDIAVPDLDDYAWILWDYWERHLDPDLFIDRSLRGHVAGKKVLITGGSSGIGKAASLMLAKAGAEVLVVARGEEALAETINEIKEMGGKAHAYRCDLADIAECDRLVLEVLKEHGHVDILINNAGRSIRRSLALSYDRFHDFTRTMQLNYFGSLKLILGFLPLMEQRRSGQIINISSIGVLSNAPRFSAYVASKAALDAFSRCAAAEFNDTGVAFTTINMPLVRTPMIAPTKMYDNVPTISAEEAAEKIRDAVIYRPQRIATRLGIFSQVLHMLAPKLSEIIMNSAFRMFPDSAAAKGMSGRKQKEARPSDEQIAFASIMRGIHW